MNKTLNKTMAFDLLVTDFKYQYRIHNNSDRIDFLRDDMEERLENKTALLDEPFAVAHIEGIYYIVDGFHRHNAIMMINEDTEKYNVTEVAINIVATTDSDAILYALQANAEHNGLARGKRDCGKAAKGAAFYLNENRKDKQWTISYKEVMETAKVSRSMAFEAVQAANAELDRELYQLVKSRLEEGSMSYRDIADELGTSKDKVGRINESININKIEDKAKTDTRAVAKISSELSRQSEKKPRELDTEPEDLDPEEYFAGGFNEFIKAFKPVDSKEEKMRKSIETINADPTDGKQLLKPAEGKKIPNRYILIKKDGFYDDDEPSPYDVKGKGADLLKQFTNIATEFLELRDHMSKAEIDLFHDIFKRIFEV